jgi:DNA-binding phage protein
MIAGTKMPSSMGRPRQHEPNAKTPEGQFALHLRALMTGRSWNHDELAKKSGLSRATIYNYTSGQHAPSITELQAIAKAFGFKSWGELDPKLS